MTNEELFSAVAIAAWKRVVVSVEKQVSSFSDDEVLMEVAPGRNRVYYIVGHLAAIHDRLLPMLGIGDRLHPELDDLFIE
ncbi:MAG TPA: DinB family protein, partial [Acidobacteriaceae bacterium]